VESVAGQIYMYINLQFVPRSERSPSGYACRSK